MMLQTYGDVLDGNHGAEVILCVSLHQHHVYILGEPELVKHRLGGSHPEHPWSV